MSVDKKTTKPLTAAAAMFAATSILGEELSQDLTLGQIRCFLCIAAAGDAGIEMESLGDALAPKGEDRDSSRASKLVSVLAETHPLKDRAGFGVVARMPSGGMDFRRKSVALTDKGRRIAKKLVDVMERVQS